MTGGSQRSDKKRQWIDEEEETVDDLAYAARFAMVTMVPNVENDSDNSVTKIQTRIEKETAADDDNIELEEPSSDDEDGEETTGNDKMDDNEEDDDQSDFDLNEALAKMDPDESLEEEEEDCDGDQDNATKGGKAGTKVPQTPKTQNEVDAYRTPIQELEENLKFQLSVTPGGGGGDSVSRRLAASNLQLAGRVKHYMAFDRTVVVESSALNPHGETRSRFWEGNAPLDEGSLLVLRPPAIQGTDKDDHAGVEHLVPLGRVFEVFGPVSQPLYTIRLPSKSPTGKNKIMDRQEHEKVEESVAGKTNGDSNSSTPADASSETNQTPSGQGNIDEEDAKGLQASKVPAKDEASVGVPVNTAETVDGKVAPPSGQNYDDRDDDPWAPNGKYAGLLQQSNPLEVYYVKDEAKMIDTGVIMRASRKGCDASNLYDEEVMYAEEMYYSDDEEEQQARHRRKSRGQKQASSAASGLQVPRRTQDKSSPAPLPTGFHHAPSLAQSNASPAAQRNASSKAEAPLPQGFLRPNPTAAVVNSPTMPYSMAQVRPYPRFYPHPSPRQAGSRNGPPPPPPPPGSSAPPPAYQY